MHEADQKLIDVYLDRIWAERGLSQNTLDSYRSDLESFANWMHKKDINISSAESYNLQSYLA